MKSKNTLFILIVQICFLKTASAQTTFQKTFATNGFNSGISGQQTNDGGYVFTGYVDNGAISGSDVVLIKTDYKGDTLWTKVYGGIDDDGGRSVYQTSDNGFVVTGFSSSFNDDVYLLKTDANGNLEWSKTYGGPDTQEGESVMQTLDNGYIIAAEDFNQYLKIFLIRTNSAGDTLWTRTLDMPGTSSRAYSIRETSDTGYILTGYINENGSENAYLVKTNPMGDTLWTKTYVANFGTEAHCVKQTSDDGYIIAGKAQQSGDNLYLLKTDDAGTEIWNRTYGYVGDEGAYSVIETDGGYIAVGQTNSFGAGDVDAYVVKTDEIGLVSWSSTYGGINWDAARCIAPATDGGYIITGFMTDVQNTSFMGYMIKTDANGNSGCNEQQQATTSGTLTITEGGPLNLVSAGCIVADAATVSYRVPGFATLCVATGIQDLTAAGATINIFPNPVTDYLYIRGTNEKGEVTVTDISGRQILKQNTQAAETNIAVKNLVSGFYMVTYHNGNRSYEEKFIKQ